MLWMLHCFRIWVTTWHAMGDTDDPGGLRHSSSTWKLCTNQFLWFLLCIWLLLARWMHPCVSEMRIIFFPCQMGSMWPEALRRDVSFPGSPSESLLKEHPTAFVFLQAVNIPDRSPPLPGSNFHFPRMTLELLTRRPPPHQSQDQHGRQNPGFLGHAGSPLLFSTFSGSLKHPAFYCPGVLVSLSTPWSFMLLKFLQDWTHSVLNSLL